MNYSELRKAVIKRAYIKKVIASCNDVNQLKPCRKMIDNFINEYPDIRINKVNLHFDCWKQRFLIRKNLQLS